MTRTTILLIAVMMLAPSYGKVGAQEQPEFPGPVKEHQWLKRFVGKWSTESKAIMAPDQPPVECTGTIDSQMFGEIWVVNEMRGNYQGTPMRGLQTIGYDPAKKKYVGTWIDGMVNHMWHYEGTVDESGKTLTLEAEGPDFSAGGKLTKYRDAYEFKAPNVIVMTSSMLSQEGEWITFMTGEAKRKATEKE